MSRTRRVLGPTVAVASALLALSLTQCLLVEDPGGAEPRFEFTAPLRDSVVNIGDTTGVLPCDLRMDGRALPCQLGLRVVEGDAAFVIDGPRLSVARGPEVPGTPPGNLTPGSARVEMRPLHVQLPTDSIVRYARLRAVVPRLEISGCPGGADTLISVGQERIYSVLGRSRDGRVIAFVPVTWLQESGGGVAAFVGGAEGWVRALGKGVAVFRVAADTATARCTVVVKGSP